MTTVQTVGICLKPDQPEAAGTVRMLVDWLEERGLGARVDEQCGALIGAAGEARDALAAGVDLLISLGGDGTLLSVARAAGAREVPILGVNLGTLGFLTEVNVEEMLPALEKVLGGEARVDRRMRLEVAVFRGGSERGRFLALNDAVVTKTAISRMIEIETRADREEVATYHADGLIVSTPTGSTAYSLSAGGPLLLPGIQAIVLTPICPHSLTQRPLVLPVESEIELGVHTRGGGATVTIDGQESMDLGDGDRVEVRRSPHAAAIVASPFRSRFQILQTKLRWGTR